jgi:hypothetical protein
MNKRILDGAALWRSDKIARIEPKRWRAEYANWIPLALANGVFEADTRRLWATVYSYNRPEILVNDVEDIKREYCRVGLVFFWIDEATGKVWGFFVGIDKAGRLSPESRIKKKHVETGPTPPADALRRYIELTSAKPLDSSVVSHWLTNGCLGSGSGSGKHTAPSAPGVSPSKNSEKLKLEQETKEAGWEAFWEEWPRRQNEATAKRAWMKVPISEYQAVMDGLKKWKSSDQWLTRAVIPHASLWLKDKRWGDEHIPQASPGRNGALTADQLKEKRSQITPEGQAMLAKAGGLIQ